MTASGSASNVRPLDWPNPKALAPAAGPPFPGDALPSWVGPFVHAVACARQVPLALPAGVALGALSTAVGRKARIQVGPEHLEPVNLFVAVVSPPGTRKSAVFSDFDRSLIRFEQEETARRRPELRARILERERLDLEAKEAKEGGDWVRAEKLTGELEQRPAPAEFRLVTRDVTPQKLVSMLCDQGGRLSIMSAEPEVFNVMAGRWNSTGGPDLDAFLSGHAGDSLRVDRGSRPSEHIEEPALTVCVCAQPHALERLGAVAGAVDRGLLARFLWVVPEDLRGGRRIHGDAIPTDVRQEFEAGLVRLLGLPAPRLPLPTLVLDGPAQVLFDQFAEEVESRLAPGGDLRDMAGWGEKLAGLVARIAGCYHLAEHGSGPRIPGDVIEQAIAVGRWGIEHAKVAFGVAGADPMLRAARAILEVVRSKGWHSPTNRDVSQVLKERIAFRHVEALKPGFGLLSDLGWIRYRAKGGGPSRPEVRFDVHPAAFTSEGIEGLRGRGQS